MSKKAFTEVDEFGRPILKETHQIAEAQKEKNSRLKAAFGIKDSFVEGSSFDRKALEEATNQMAKKYDIVPMEDPKPAKKKKKTKKKDTSPSSSSSSSPDSEEEKRKQKLKRKAPSPSISREKDTREAEKLTGFPKIKDERDDPPRSIRRKPILGSGSPGPSTIAGERRRKWTGQSMSGENRRQIEGMG